MFEVSEDEIVEGPIARTLMVLSAPLIVQTLSHVAQSIIDVFWLGQWSSDAVAAVGLVLPAVSVGTILAVQTAFVGTQVVAAQRVGGDNHAGARRIVAQGMLLGVLIGAVLAAAFALGAGSIVRLLGASEEIAPLAATYMATYALAFPIMGLSDGLEAGFVAWGDSRASMYINLAFVGADIILDPIFIFGWGPVRSMGVYGAALATVCGVFVGLLVAIIFTLRARDSLSLSRTDFVFNLGDMRELLDVGAPPTGRRLAQDAVRVLMVGIVATTSGAAGLAAYTIGARIATVAFIPASGLGQAAQSMIGQNLGADQPERAERTTWIGLGLAVGGLTIVGILQWLFPHVIAGVFVPNATGAAFDLTVEYLRILAYGYWALGGLYVVRAGFNGARRTRVSFIIGLVQYWGVRLPAAYVGAVVLGFGVTAIFWAVTLSNILATVSGVVYYRYSTAQGMLIDAASVANGEAE